MKLFKQVLLLVIALLFVTVTSKRVYAQACQDGCQTTYDLCLMNASLACADCTVQADHFYDTCNQNADSWYENCMWTAYPWPAAMAWCEEHYWVAQQNCATDYFNYIDTCEENRIGAEAGCYTAYESCMVHCP